MPENLSPKSGDTVHVEFDAMLLDVGRHRTLIETPSGFHIVIPNGVAGLKITPIARPLQVGDLITIGDAPEPPDGTVLIYENGEVIRRNRDRWAFASTSPVTYAWAELSAGSALVAFVGTGK